MKSKRMYRRKFESKLENDFRFNYKNCLVLMYKSIHAEKEEVIDTGSGDGR